MFVISSNTFAPASDDTPLEQEDLTHNLHLLGSDWRIANQARPQGALRHGNVRTQEICPGLVLYHTAGQDLYSLRTTNELHPGLKLCLLLSGSSELAYGNRHFVLGPDAAQGVAALVNLTEPDAFTRQWQRGRSERKLVLTLRPEWFSAAGVEDAGIDAFLCQHLAVAPWQPSPRVLALAEQLCNPPPLPVSLQRLWLESRCLDIVVEALASVCQPDSLPVPPTGLDARSYQRLCGLRDFLDSGAADGMNLSAIARHVGMSAAHLQRHFPKVVGTSVIDYLRRRRLHTARQALERGEADVVAAARLAGYGSAANFATAFRRCFGITPRQVLQRI